MKKKGLNWGSLMGMAQEEQNKGPGPGGGEEGTPHPMSFVVVVGSRDWRRLRDRSTQEQGLIGKNSWSSSRQYVEMDSVGLGKPHQVHGPMM